MFENRKESGIGDLKIGFTSTHQQVRNGIQPLRHERGAS
jgi:hypothetical protein